jgi:hypothetical protein
VYASAYQRESEGRSKYICALYIERASAASPLASAMALVGVGARARARARV